MQGRGSAPRPAGRRGRLTLVTLLATGAATVSLAGCAKMDQALAKQWMVVDFSPSTSVATALHVRAACSHIQNTPPLPLPGRHSELDIMYGVEYDTTGSSLANLAELQTCLGKFKSVLGVSSQDAGDEGS